MCVRACVHVIQTRHGTRREQRYKKSSEDKAVAQRAGIKESVGNIRPLWPLHVLGRCLGDGEDGEERKQEEETKNEPEMQYGKSKEFTGGRKGGGRSRRRERDELF